MERQSDLQEKGIRGLPNYIEHLQPPVHDNSESVPWATTRRRWSSIDWNDWLLPFSVAIDFSMIDWVKTDKMRYLELI